ncbi:MAG: hypothetical protein ACRDQ5_09800 [Sciscionella sp.]
MPIDTYVIPVDFTAEPVHVVRHEAKDGLTVLRREIGVQRLDLSTFRTP